MLLIYFLISITMTYYLNIDENKIFIPSLNYSEYDLQQQKVIQYQISTIKDNVTIIDIATETLQNNIIQVVVLAIDSLKVNKVYSMTYNYLLLNNFTITQQTLNAVACDRIALLQQQYILSCGMKLILENKTQIELKQQLTHMKSFQNGIVSVTNKEINIMDSSFNLTFYQNCSAIDVIVANRYLYILTNTNIEIHLIDRDEEIERINHNCQVKPTTFAIFSDFIYVYCKELKKIDNKGKITIVNNFNSSKINLLGQTNNFLVINQNQIYNKQDQLLYESNSSLFSLNYGDQFLQYDKNEFKIIQIFDRSIINAKNFTTFKISKNQFTVIDYGIQIVNSSLKQTSFHRPQTNNQLYYDDFLLGANLTVQGNGLDVLPLQKEFPTLGLFKVLKYEENEIVFFYHDFYEKNNLSQIKAMTCNFYIDEKIIYDCNQKFLLYDDQFQNSKLVYDYETDQIVFMGYSEQNITIFIDDQKFILNDTYQNIYLSEQLLVILSNDLFLTIYRLDIQQYILEDKIKLDTQPQSLALSNNQICLIFYSSSVIIYQYTVFGWQKSMEEKFNNSVQNAHFHDDQLFIFFQKEMIIYESLIQRGKVLIGLQNYTVLNSDNFLYLQNCNETIQFNVSKQNALSTSILRQLNNQVFQIKNIVSLGYYELNFFDDQVLAYSNKKQFKIETISNEQQYYKSIPKLYVFNGLNNSTTKLEIDIVGTKLKLKASAIEKDHKFANKFFLDDFFSGPVSNLSIKESDKAKLIQQISQLDEIPDWAIQNNVIDFLDIGEGKTIVYSYQLLSLCQNNQCEQLQTISDLDCKSLDQDLFSIFLICDKYLYQLNKNNLKNQSKWQLNFKQPIKFTFESNYMAVLDKNQTIYLFENFKLKGTKEIYNVVDIILNQGKLFVLTETQIFVQNLDFIILYDLELLQQLTFQDDKAVFLDTKFTQFIYYKYDQYIILTNNALIYRIEIINFNSYRTLSKLVPIPNFTPIQIQILNNSTFSIVFQNKEQNYIMFYNSQNEIIPYYQSLQVHKKISKYYIRQYDGNKFLMRDLHYSNKFIGYQINPYYTIQFLSKSIQNITLIADDLGAQQASTTIQFYNIEEENESSNQLYWIGYVIVLVFIILIGCAIIYRYGRRYQLLKKINFVEDRPNSDSGNENNI